MAKDKLTEIIVFFSGGASAFTYLRDNDAKFGKSYRIVGAFTDNPDAKGIGIMRQENIPLITLDLRAWCENHSCSWKDLEARKYYFAEACKRIRPYGADIILCAGFMLIITEPMLLEYEERILNVHPADMTIKDTDGLPKYRGKYAVRDALRAGEQETRSTVHIITKEVDDGPIVALSPPLSVVLGRTWQEHQEQQKTLCDGPAYVEALSRC